MNAKLYAYFRYHHFNQNVTKSSHSSYLNTLSALEDYGKISEISENNDIKGDWEKIKTALKNLNSEQVEELLKLKLL